MSCSSAGHTCNTRHTHVGGSAGSWVLGRKHPKLGVFHQIFIRLAAPKKSSGATWLFVSPWHHQCSSTHWPVIDHPSKRTAISLPPVTLFGVKVWRLTCRDVHGCSWFQMFNTKWYCSYSCFLALRNFQWLFDLVSPYEGICQQQSKYIYIYI